MFWSMQTKMNLSRQKTRQVIFNVYRRYEGQFLTEMKVSIWKTCFL